MYLFSSGRIVKKLGKRYLKGNEGKKISRPVKNLQSDAIDDRPHTLLMAGS
jgi:hypothetical protein